MALSGGRAIKTREANVHDAAVIAGAGAMFVEWGPVLIDPSPRRARIVNAFTEPHARRQGLARALVTSLIDTLRDEHAIAVVTLASTPMSDALYRSLGFEPYPNERMLRIETPRR